LTTTCHMSPVERGGGGCPGSPAVLWSFVSGPLRGAQTPRQH
jgi:hypothetical protein